MCSRLLLLLLWAGVCLAGAVEPALISVGETWSFLPGTNEPPAGWNGIQHDDGDWRRGEAGFGVSVRGENTQFIGIPRGFGTMYFRRPFVVEDPAAVSALILRMDWQGGFVAYLNGTEVARRGLGIPGIPPDVTARGEWRVAGAAEDLVLTNGPALLLPGTNVLAVASHPPDFAGYDIVLVPELLANFHRGPYVQCSAPGRLDVLWRTPLQGPAGVEFGPTAELGSFAPAEASASYQFAALTNVPAGAAVHYRVRVDTGQGVVRSPIYRFRTVPDSGRASVILLGDSGTGARSQFEVARQISRVRDQADALVHLGDIVYPGFSPGLTDTRCLSVYREALRELPSFMTWGNHDLSLGMAPFQAAFRMPTNPVVAAEHLADRTQPDSYYSFDVGDAHFAVLYWPWSLIYAIRPDSPQLRWLEADLAASDRRWKFLCLHHPVNTSSVHRFDDYDGSGVADRLEVQQVLLPVAERHGVRLIFSGHDHAYERFQPVGRTTTVVSGGGGSGLYGVLEMDTNSAAFYRRWHHLKLDVAGDFARLTALASDGTPLDALEFRDTPADSPDADGDGLGDLAEELAGCDPRRPDTDGDGLPDGWEFLRGLDPARPSVTPGADGTIGPGDPRRLAELLSVPIPRPATELRVHPLPDGRIQLRWLGVVGARVQLESASSLEEGFVPLAESPARDLADDRQALELPADAAGRYFRVRLADSP